MRLLGEEVKGGGAVFTINARPNPAWERPGKWRGSEGADSKNTKRTQLYHKLLIVNDFLGFVL
jgi:hypothetical protein